MTQQEINEWLLQGDVSIQYQVHRDLLGQDRPDLRDRIASEGWGCQFLAQRKEDGHWGDHFYQPKWISTHYTLLDLCHLNIYPTDPLITESITKILDHQIADDGGIQLGPSTSHHSDVCVNAMFLNYASYFGIQESRLTSIVDSILAEIMPDGGFNCMSTRSGATHSSLHSTISVLEGFAEFVKTGHIYRSADIAKAKESAEAFILLHQLFISDRTGKVIKDEFLRFPYPDRWKYNILRALDYFSYVGKEWDPRMGPAFEVILTKRRKDGRWNVQSPHPGQVHFVMEQAGKPSRWNTLRALRVLKHFGR